MEGFQVIKQKTLFLFSFVFLSLLCSSFLISATDVEHVFPGSIDVTDVTSSSPTRIYLDYYFSDWDYYGFRYYDDEGELVNATLDRCGGLHVYDAGQNYYDLWLSCVDPFGSPPDDEPYIEFFGYGSDFVLNPVNLIIGKDGVDEYEIAFVYFADDDYEGFTGAGGYPSEYSVAPYFVGTIPIVDVGYGDAIGFTLDEYVENFQQITLEWHDDILDTDFFVQAGLNSEETCYAEGGDVTICTQGAGSTVVLKFYSNFNDVNKTINFTATNSYGSIYTSFLVKSSSDADYEYETYYPIEEGTTASFVGYFTSLLNKIFPPKDTLSTKTRFGYVLITALLINFLIIYGLSRIDAVKYAVPFLGFLDIVLVFYFTAVGYIPLGFVIITGLIGLVLLIFKVKGG